MIDKSWRWAFALFVLAFFSANVRAQDVATEVEQRVKAALKDRFDIEDRSIKVEAYRLSETVPDPFSLQLSGWNVFPTGKRQIRLLPSSREEPTGWALLHIRRFDSVWVAHKTIRQGRAITPGELRRQWLEVTELTRPPLPSSLFAKSKEVEARRYLEKGRILRKGDVRLPYALEVGNKINMLYKSGRIRMRLDCEARQPGRAGDVIRLYCPTTKSTYRAQLLSSSHATWIETL